MMQIQKINSLNTNGQNSACQSVISMQAVPKLNADELSFSGKADMSKINKTLEDIMPNALTGMKRAKDSLGEVQNILINAFGTGLIAPIFIKWNPLSKTDEDTRTYSALRQPVSAVLAVCTQAAVTIPFNKAITSMAKKGELFDKFDESPFTGDAAKEKTLNDIKNKNTIYNAKSVAIDKTIMKKLLINRLEKMKKNEDSEFTKCNGIKKDLRVKRSKFYQANSKDCEKLLNEISEKLNSTKDFKEIDKFLTKKIKDLEANKADAELIKITKEIKDRGMLLKENWFSKFIGLFSSKKSTKASYSDVVIAAMNEKVDKMKGHVDIYKNLKTPEAAEAHAIKSINERANSIKEAQNFLDEAIKKVKDGATVNDIEKMFTEKTQVLAEEAKSNPLKAFRLKDKVFSKEVLAEYKEFITNNVKTFKQISGLLVSFMMLPITCALLNYLYPIFMDAVFPNLSKKKSSNKSSDLVVKTTKNSEVK